MHAAGGLCFYDHANFNGVMGKIRAAELGFDACMFMLHKTFGAPKAGGGPAVGAYGCTEKLVPYLPGPLVTEDGGRFGLTEPPRVSAASASSWATCRRCSRPTPGSGRWAPRASARRLTCPSSPATTSTRLMRIRGVTRPIRS